MKFIFLLRIFWFKKLRTVVEAKFVNAREELNFGAEFRADQNFDIEDYSFVNIAAEYEVTPHFSIFGRIDNLTNEHYSERSSVSRRSAAPRTVA